MDIVMNISDRIAVLNFGRKIAEGSPEEVADNPEVRRVYLGGVLARWFWMKLTAITGSATSCTGFPWK
jgi:ABC-type dipeptide/oligopeptide/nickel transport system ATPase component